MVELDLHHVDAEEIKIVCSCGFTDIAENFHALQKYVENGPEWLRHVYIGCPKCGRLAFFQHFRTSDEEFDPRIVTVSYSHLYAIPANLDSLRNGVV